LKALGKEGGMVSSREALPWENTRLLAAIRVVSDNDLMIK